MSITKDQTVNPASDVSRAVRDKHREYLLPATIQYYKEPLVLTEGKGLRVRDADGNTYLDFFGGILTVSVGHANDKVNAAIMAQVARLGARVDASTRPCPIVELAERLARLSPRQPAEVRSSATSGTEADETAVMLAQLSTGASGDHRAAPRLLRALAARAVPDRARDVAPAAGAGRRASSTRSRRTAIAARFEARPTPPAAWPAPRTSRS